MDQKFWGLLIVIAAFAAGFSVNNIAISNTRPDYKVAVVDIQKIVANSKEISALRAEQEKKIITMQKTVDTARTEMAKEKDQNKLTALEEKYRNQINNQKIAMDKEYNDKLIAIDNNIKTAVIEKARAMNYDMVLPKNVILFGGDDITELVAPAVK